MKFRIFPEEGKKWARKTQKNWAYLLKKDF